MGRMRRWVLVLGLSLAGTTWADEPAERPDAGLAQKLFDFKAQTEPSRMDTAVSRASEELRAELPRDWQGHRVWGLQPWQWLALPLLGVLIALLTLLLVRLTGAVIRRLRPDPEDAARTIGGVAGPLRLWWGALLARAALPALALSPGAHSVWVDLLRIAAGAGFFWAALRAVTAWNERFASSTYAAQRPGSRALVGLSAQVLRFFLMALALLAVVSELGYSVGSVLAGLGIGGIALALGAQKTLENLFGAFALAIDQPIREGELVKVDDVVGHVENIGLRSTRIRTFDRTLVTIPNGKLSELRLETYAARDRIRLHTFIGVAYGTTAAQMKEVVEGCRDVLLAHERIFKDNVSVRFARLGDSSLDVEVVAWFLTTDFEEFRRFREEALLSFLSVVEQAGTSVAFPTRTVHLVTEK